MPPAQALHQGHKEDGTAHAVITQGSAKFACMSLQEQGIGAVCRRQAGLLALHVACCSQDSHHSSHAIVLQHMPRLHQLAEKKKTTPFCVDFQGKPGNELGCPTSSPARNYVCTGSAKAH